MGRQCLCRGDIGRHMSSRVGWKERRKEDEGDRTGWPPGETEDRVVTCLGGRETQIPNPEQGVTE